MGLTVGNLQLYELIAHNHSHSHSHSHSHTKTEKPQLIAEASVIRVATTYFPTHHLQYHRRCGA